MYLSLSHTYIICQRINIYHLPTVQTLVPLQFQCCNNSKSCTTYKYMPTVQTLMPLCNQLLGASAYMSKPAGSKWLVYTYHQHTWEWFMHAIKINTSTGKWSEIVRWSWLKICASPHLSKVGFPSPYHQSGFQSFLCTCICTSIESFVSIALKTHLFFSGLCMSVCHVSQWYTHMSVCKVLWSVHDVSV